MLIANYFILFVDYKNPLHSKAARERIATSASTLDCYDLGYNKVMGKNDDRKTDKGVRTMRKSEWHTIGLNSRHKRTIGVTCMACIHLPVALVSLCHQNSW
jgi:hypothetical protein